MTEWLLLGVSVLLIFACGVFVAGEFALLTVDRPTVERLAAEGDRQARGLQSAFASLSTQLSGVQLAITLTNLAIGLLAEPAMSHLIVGPLAAMGVSERAVPGIAVGLALVISTLATMLFGELLPKNLAISIPLTMARATQGPVRGFSWLMRWPIRLLDSSANVILSWFGLHTQEELASARSAQELASLVRHSADEGTLQVSTARLIVRSLTLGTHLAGEIMTARTRMVTVPETATVAEFLAEVQASGMSRLPVTASDGSGLIVGVGDLDRAVRIPYAKRARTPIGAAMSPPVRVPETLPADDVLTEMQRAGAPLVIVIDEYGDTAGLITGEDVLEELVGDIQDEFESAGPEVVPDGDGWDVSGQLRPDEVLTATGLRLPDEGPFHTVGGLIMHRLGRIPVAGDELEVDGVQLTVRSLTRRRVDRVLLHAADVDDAAATANAADDPSRDEPEDAS